jgi:hypothetical protein
MWAKPSASTRGWCSTLEPQSFCGTIPCTFRSALSPSAMFWVRKLRTSKPFGRSKIRHAGNHIPSFTSPCARPSLKSGATRTQHNWSACASANHGRRKLSQPGSNAASFRAGPDAWISHIRRHRSSPWPTLPSPERFSRRRGRDQRTLSPAPQEAGLFSRAHSAARLSKRIAGSGTGQAARLSVAWRTSMMVWVMNRSRMTVCVL